MEITIRQMDEVALPLVDQCDSTFIVDSRLVLSAQDGRISYSIVPVAPREKSYPPEQKDYHIYLYDPDKVVFFAYGDGDLAGQIRVWKYWNAYAYIDDIAVDPKHRRQGVGRALIQNAIAWAKAKGCPGLMLETQDINVAACRLYESCGFELGGFDRFLYKGLHPATDEIALYWYLMF
jgi:streptothricin acetyltransferase